MKVTKTEDSALRLAMGLAHLGGQATLSELADEAGLSEALSAKILGMLRRGGVVRVVRGRHGHYALEDRAERVTVASVIRALGMPLFHGCLASSPPVRSNYCPNEQDCGLRPLWRHLESEVTRVFEGITLADLMHSETRVEEQMASLAATHQKETEKGLAVELEPIAEAVEEGDETYETEQ